MEARSHHLSTLLQSMESIQTGIAEMSNAIEEIPEAEIQSLSKLFEELERLAE